MQDVIFAGTEKRKQVNYAEVSLVLDNSDKMFPIDFDEVVVTRRVFRSGESLYQINRANCRLKDIHELFMDTGLGRDGYSMIGQGNVSQILSTKAEDRRSFFEEAAGVSKYKHRKDESERKLASVQDNILRITDITSELEGRLGPLERQSHKARQYMVLYEEYKKLDIGMCVINLERNKELLAESEKRRTDIEGEISELRANEDEIERKRNELYLKSSSKDEEQALKNNELIENESKNMTAANDISIAENDIKNNNIMSERIGKEIEALEKGISENESNISGLEAKIEEQTEKTSGLLEHFETIRVENNSIFSRLEGCKGDIDGLKSEVIEKMNELSAKKANINGIELLRASFIERREAVEAELRNHGKGIEDTKTEIAETEKRLAERSEKCAAMRERTEKQQQRESEYRRRLAENRDKLNEMRVSLNSKTSQKRILEGMENDYEGYARSVKAVLKAPELRRAEIYGTVSGLIETERRYVTAIEISLGGALQNIVVENESDAKEAIAYLKRTKSGRATFLPVSSVSGRLLENTAEISKKPGYIGIAVDLIKFDKKYTGIMRSLLGRVVVVDGIDNAIAISREFGYKFKAVTLEGEVLNAGGSMSGGSNGRASGFLSRANDIKLLGEEIVRLTADIRTLNEENTALENDLKNASAQLENYIPLLREYENDILICKNTLEHLSNTLENSGASEKAFNDELEQIEEQLKKSADEIAALLSNQRETERAIETLNNEISEKESEYDAIAAEKEEKSKQLMDETLLLRTLEKDIQAERASIEELRQGILRSRRAIEEKTADRQKLLEQNVELEAKIADGRREIETIKELSEEIKARIEAIEKEKSNIVESLKQIQTSNKDLTDRLLVLQQQLSKEEGRQQRLESDTEAMVNRLWEDYEITVSEAEAAEINIEDEQESRKRTAELKAKIKSLGSVNVDAIEEYKETKERFDFLSSQREDLEKSRENLNKVIASMQELMEEHFTKQFEEINRSFSKVFAELFGGGRGKLYLSDPKDVMASGIEIEVQLPGKGLQNINLYSGGEKSFIAIALLFAILEVKPTPFCILDEIDAALDDVNVSRFATYLKNYLAQTQFIVITHRRGTMEAANIMYGVTMQEKGVSKLLSLHIDDVGDEMLK